MILIALGGNIPGRIGSPLQTLRWALEELVKNHIYVIASSSFYRSRAIGQEGQLDYINAVVKVRAAKSAINILKNLKQIEERAGRQNQPLKIAGRWSARSLDLDIVDYNGHVSRHFHVCNGDRARNARSNTQCKLVLPHPHAHRRPFVMQPIVDINPFWHHPVSGLSAISIAKRLQKNTYGEILQKVD